MGRLEERLGSLATGAANLFPLWLMLGAAAAMLHPPSLTWFKREYTTQGLALTMMAMGTTLTLDVRLQPPCKYGKFAIFSVCMSQFSSFSISEHSSACTDQIKEDDVARSYVRVGC